MNRLFVIFGVFLSIVIEMACSPVQTQRESVKLPEAELNDNPVVLDDSTDMILENDVIAENEITDAVADPTVGPVIGSYPWIKGHDYSLKTYNSVDNQNSEAPLFICDPLDEDTHGLVHVWPVKDGTDSEQATFKIVDGLANSFCFSFESKSSAGHYLRDWGLSAKVFKKPDGQNSSYDKSVTFKIVPALTGDPFPYISIESYNRAGNYLFSMQPAEDFQYLLGIGKGETEAFNKAATFRLEVQPTTLPNNFVFVGANPEDSELGDINSEAIQGIAHNDTNWFISNNKTIYKTRKNQIKSVVKKVNLSDIQNHLGFGGYDHFGDMDFYDGLLYVATTGDHAPIVIVFDENLNFKKYAYFPPNKQCGAGWVAINPATGYLYSSDPYRVLHVYDRKFDNNSILTPLHDIDLTFKYGAPNEEEWEKVWNQGGAFSPNGVFYYVLDHKSDEDSEYTGIHSFLIHGNYAEEITINGSNNKNQRVSFINRKYNPDLAGYRRWELEGLTIWKYAEAVGQIHLLQLHNEAGTDDVHLLHYKVDNDY